MKNGIPATKYYELLEWKDENFDAWHYRSSHVYGVTKLCDMSTEQLRDLYLYVFDIDISI